MNIGKQIKKASKRKFVHDEVKCKKDEIVMTARNLFYENGYAKTSVNIIQKEAGVSKGLIYYHFKNKDDLAVGVLQDVLDTELREHENLINRARNATGVKEEILEIIDDYFHSIFEIKLQNVNTMQLIFDLLLNVQIDEYRVKVKKLYQGYLEKISEFLKLIGNTNCDTNAKLILSMLDGLTYINYTLDKTLTGNEMAHIISAMKCILNLETKKHE